MLKSLRERDALMRSIRAFFHDRDYVEVDTPIRLPTPCMETHIDAEPSGDHFLRTSPELFHKKLLGAGARRVFEVGKCFRAGERGPWHHPEYTMLEWYQADADYMDVLRETRELIAFVWPDAPTETNVWTVSEAFLEHAGWDPALEWNEDRFDLDLVEKVEPALRGIGGVAVLKDYPIEAAALSRKKANDPSRAERWELYIDGVELANAYSELTDAAEQRRRFEVCAEQRRALGKTVYDIDEDFLSALERMPPCGGVALGVDRLLMLMMDADSLDAVLPFR